MPAGGWIAIRTVEPMSEVKNTDEPCPTCPARPISGCPPPGLPPAQFWMGLATVAVATVMGYTTLQIEVRELVAWRKGTVANRFTSGDGAALEARAAQERELQASFMRDICEDVRRLKLEMGKIPRSNCRTKE